MNEELTQNERKFVALAIQGLAMRGGPQTFQLVQSIIRKLELEAELHQLLQSWLEYSEHGEGESEPLPQPSALGDLTGIARHINDLLTQQFGSRPALALVFQLPPNKQAHWVTNVTRPDGIALFRAAAQRMEEEANQ